MKEAFKVMDAFLRNDIPGLRNLSDGILAKGAIEENKDLVELSIVAHALSKILQKEYYKKDRKLWKSFVNDIVNGLKDVGSGKKNVEEIVNRIKSLDEHFGRYSDNIIHMSRIRRGSTLYAWGFSLTLASSLVGAPEHEIMSHTGKTKIVDEENVSRSASERLKDAEEIL